MSNEQAHDPTVTLRLELGRVTDQRNAYQSALHKDVLKVIYDATLAADAGFADTVGDLEKEVSDLQMENAYLKAEVERLKEGNDCLDKMHEKEMARSAYLCEEVNRTTAWGRGLESDLSHARVEISFLKAEVARLTDAITAGAITPDARIVP